jgi:hypothetical protein
VDEYEVSLSSRQHCVLTEWDVLDAQNGNNLPVCQSVEEISGQLIGK